MATLNRSPLNRTQLQHISLGIKIYKAMKAAIKSGLPQYVTNRKGEPIVRIIILAIQPMLLASGVESHKLILLTLF